MPTIQMTPFPLIPKQRIIRTNPLLRASLPPHCKLFLHRDVGVFDHKYVAKVVQKAIDDMSFEEACDKATEAYIMGHSLLRVCPQELAEDYCKKIRTNNVMATIEVVGIFSS
jgi:ATP-dependent Clp protease adapter protein ClpS